MAVLLISTSHTDTRVTRLHEEAFGDAAQVSRRNELARRSVRERLRDVAYSIAQSPLFGAEWELIVCISKERESECYILGCCARL